MSTKEQSNNKNHTPIIIKVGAYSTYPKEYIMCSTHPWDKRF